MASRVDELSKKEREAWKQLCGLLLEAKAVTVEELKARRRIGTPGQRLLHHICRWGTLSVQAELAAAKEFG